MLTDIMFYIIIVSYQIVLNIISSEILVILILLIKYHITPNISIYLYV